MDANNASTLQLAFKLLPDIISESVEVKESILHLGNVMILAELAETIICPALPALPDIQDKEATV